MKIFVTVLLIVDFIYLQFLKTNVQYNVHFQQECYLENRIFRNRKKHMLLNSAKGTIRRGANLKNKNPLNYFNL